MNIQVEQQIFMKWFLHFTFKDKWEKLNLKEIKDLDTNIFTGELLLDIIPIRSKET